VAEVEHLISAIRTSNSSSDLTYIDPDPAAATRAYNLAVSQKPFDGLVVNVTALETPHLILSECGHAESPPSLQADVDT